MKQIAVIEPDYAHFRWIRFILREAWKDIECARFESAVAALEHWSRVPDRPDLILMAWRLPIMKGAEVIRRLREMAGFERLPLVAMVASDPERQQAEAAGIPTVPAPVNELFAETVRRYGDRALGGSKSAASRSGPSRKRAARNN